MAYEIHGFKLGTLKAPSTAFSVKQYHCVTANSCEGFIATPSDSAPMIGVMQGAPTVTGESVEIVATGVTKVAFNASIAAGSNFIVGTSGRIHSTGSAAAGGTIYGPVLVNPGTTAGDIGTVVLNVIGKTT